MSSAGPSAWGDERTKFFFELTPDRVLAAVESSGLLCTGRCLTLNSFENRVYDVELDPESPGVSAGPTGARRVAKFYRPGRWSEKQILEEHEFLHDLIEAEIPAIAPLPFPDGRTLHQMPDSGIWYAIFPKVGGRAPDELTSEQLRIIGRLLARIHTVGASREAPHRVRIDPTTYGLANLEFLLERELIPLDFRARYEAAVRAICAQAGPLFAAASTHRIHGDCHLGNLLWNGTQAFFLDFDDMVRGPAVQDMWLLIPGRD
ncbi:MAG: serine/threonine protein kinase, partial [Bdellovibrionota bacterium]